MTAPSAAEMESLARQRWGEPPNKALSTRAELRFGRNGSKSVKLADGIWYDHEENVGGGYRDLYKAVHGVYPTNGEDRAAVFRAPPGMAKEIGNPVAWWDYHDADGARVLRVVRFEPAGADKTFRQCRPDGDRWIWSLKGFKTPLYHLPELLAAAPGVTVFITEGEKHVDLIRSWGFLATTNAAGAKKFRPHHAQVLAAFDCVILPDNDEAGSEHEAVVTREMRAAGCTSIRVLNLPDLPPKGDIIDWVKTGGTRDIFVQLAADARPAQEKTKGNGHDPDPPPVSWRVGLERNDKGTIRSNLFNALWAFEHAPELIGIAAYDEMLRITILTRNVPGSLVANVAPPRPVRDSDITAIQRWLQREENGMYHLGEMTVRQAFNLAGQQHAFHPVQQYLNSLQWDGNERLWHWLSTYFSVHQCEYSAKIGTMFLISMVARIFDPGCKADYMLVLEGAQGTMKSSACAVLAGGWFSDSLPALHNGDPVRLSTHLCGKWLIEIGELSSFNKAEAGALKAFLTQRVERYTPKYGHSEVIEPRQCIFIGTTNKKAYLRDETGGRRSWPVSTDIIDIVGLAEDRDQLFAEAVHRYRAGEDWWPDRKFEEEHILPQQEARFECDAWEEPVLRYLRNVEKTTVMEIASGPLGIFTGRVGTADQRRIIAILEREGWRRGNKTNTGVPWLKPLH